MMQAQADPALQALVDASEASLPANAARLASLGADAARLWRLMRAAAERADPDQIEEIRHLARRLEVHPSARDDAAKALRMLSRHIGETLEAFLARMTQSDRPSSVPETTPLVADRPHVVTAARQLAQLLPNGNRGPQLALERGLPTVTARTGLGLLLGFGDGTIACVHDDGRHLVQRGEAREPGSQWVALDEVSRGGEPLVAAAEARGVVHLWRADLGELVVAIPLAVGAPVALAAEGEWFVVATRAGRMVRVRTVAPDAPESFVEPREPVVVVALDHAGGGCLAAITDSGQVLFYDARDPVDPPWAWQPSGRRACRAVPADDNAAIVVDDQGGLWLVGPRSHRATELGFRLGPGLVGLSHVGRFLFAATADGTLHAMTLSQDGTLGPPQKRALGEPLAALI